MGVHDEENCRPRTIDDNRCVVDDFCSCDKGYDYHTQRDPTSLREYLSKTPKRYHVPTIFGPDAAGSARLIYPVLEIDTVYFSGNRTKLYTPAPAIEVLCNEGDLSLARIAHEEFIEFYNMNHFKMARMNAKLLQYAWNRAMSSYYQYMISLMR